MGIDQEDMSGLVSDSRREGGIEFHILSFEGPDLYARAGGLASRVIGLSESLALQGFETHLWFVGDPDLPGHERAGKLHLHRWCQWLSTHHQDGVYDGEEAKVEDYSRSLPEFVVREHLIPRLRRGGRAIVLAEEWQTSEAYLRIGEMIQSKGLDARVGLYWNANNTFGFDRMDWDRLRNHGVLTTVSRYMKHRLWEWGVDPLVIPNGLSGDAYAPPSPSALRELRSRLRGRLSLAKMARFDPDKGWLQSIAVVDDLKRRGLKPLLIARGGVEAHGADVFAKANAFGLRVEARRFDETGPRGLISAMSGIDDLDILSIESHVDPDARRVLFRGVDAVLANSRHEPFGLVGLEAMAAGGVACTGSTGEDYAVSGRNAIVLDTGGAAEPATELARLKRNPKVGQALRRAGRSTARDYAWPRVIDRVLLPKMDITTA